jgi:hypothetical protein
MKLKEDLNGIQHSVTLDALQKSDFIEKFLDDYLAQEKSVNIVCMLLKTY